MDGLGCGADVGGLDFVRMRCKSLGFIEQSSRYEHKCLALVVVQERNVKPLEMIWRLF